MSNSYNIINKKKFCTRCGTTGHNYKNCEEPMTSWGIILLNLNGMKSPFINYDNNEKKYNQRNTKKYMKKMIIENEYYMEMILNNIEFLLVSRKHSLGFTDFINGKYEPEASEYILYLFKQMSYHEKLLINKSLSMDINDDFDFLWDNLWGKADKYKYASKNKKESKKKYNILKYGGKGGPKITIKDILDIELNNNTYKPEWGFPKGRINKNEDHMTCAIREFKEETGYLDNDFKIIEEIEPLEEILRGTNGKKYKHIYYVAELKTDKKPRNNITESQKEEIGDIMFMNHITAVSKIRNYHKSKLDILNYIFTLYVNLMIDD
jgi:8-oxo-dGTP pyrophosphatase MutT (NUDIX family)